MKAIMAAMQSLRRQLPAGCRYATDVTMAGILDYSFANHVFLALKATLFSIILSVSCNEGVLE